jgi:methionyl-tRNA formyltransferase
LKVYHAEKELTTPTHSPGQFDTDKKTYLRFAAADGYIRLTEIQLEGKKKMEVKDFLRGWHTPPS